LPSAFGLSELKDATDCGTDPAGWRGGLGALACAAAAPVDGQISVDPLPSAFGLSELKDATDCGTDPAGWRGGLGALACAAAAPTRG
ncbi:hypothetical protein VT930_15035, partial [Mycobacterium sherrisii]|uniref:hypothetical protein n=1 Tax=Mycobacterium sherrisii TaxID=243061 RepID=UPI002DDD307C